MDSTQFIVPDPNGFKGHTFDALLAAGYYRMQHFMFTCNDVALGADEPLIPVFWLRTLVKDCKPGNAAKTILKKCLKFSVSFQQAYVDDEIEALYAKYKQHVSFSVSASCTDYLHHEFLHQPFNAMMVQVRDQDELIAVGYFDKGEQAIAGIMNIYHPEYHSYSLGKFLILQKLHYARSQNYLFYYTGYISTGSTRFDYKTFPDPSAVEIFLPDKHEWVLYNLWSKPRLSEYYLQHLVSSS